jgi:hypothetical protein
MVLRARTSHNQETLMKTEAPPKLNVKINYAGRQLGFTADPNEQVIALRTRAMDRFKIHADRDALALFTMDNTQLEDDHAVGAYPLTKGETLVLRQRDVGGG